MELSWSYIDTMRRISSCTTFRGVDCLSGDYFPVALSFELNRNGCEVPIYCGNRIESILDTVPDNICDVVLPLCVDTYRKTCSGAETIIKHFIRSYCSARLAKAITPKGEVYYGAGGIILDKNFNPLMLATTRFAGLVEPYPGSTPICRYDGVTIHLHPNVFLDDTAVLNKSLAKKGMQFFLSQEISNWNNSGTAKIVIDDCSQFFKKADKPDVNNTSPEAFGQVLKDNIGEVLGQFIADDQRI